MRGDDRSPTGFPRPDTERRIQPDPLPGRPGRGMAYARRGTGRGYGTSDLRFDFLTDTNSTGSGWEANTAARMAAPYDA